MPPTRPPRKVGYARVSTDEQSLALQEDALGRTGCSVVFRDRGVSGAEFSRPGLDAALAELQRGDTLVVWRLDRLGRSLAKLVDLVESLGRRGIHFESLSEAICTNTAGGTLIFHVMAALAQFERSLISERTRAGLEAARSRGATLGRKRSLNFEQQMEALKLLEVLPSASVARHFQVHPRTLRRLELSVRQ